MEVESKKVQNMLYGLDLLIDAYYSHAKTLWPRLTSFI